ncbi:hypothetical protein [Lacipirellula limnantheis]|uniref:Uncharacterized protein n=1 Tax=Lacipirellula limnantheis TaxID=2528024 RepID=A0A517U1J6_9BACT|nr:hypothetical protein [Lacipirellula limnantheis]QDT74504.1 hypothetical protein I41_37010 [Lacipirellula limnantheis]
MLPKLKRTVAVTCLLATACFVILWMRSFRYNDIVAYREPTRGWWRVESKNAGLVLRRIYPQSGQDTGRLFFDSSERRNLDDLISFPLPAFYAGQVFWGMLVPYWLMVTISGLTGISLLIRRPFRFSLKTLAIAATVIIVTLGMGVAASRLTLG